MIKKAIVVFVILEIFGVVLCGIIRLTLAEIYPSDYSRESLRKITFSRLPFEDLLPAKGKEEIVFERNHKVHNLMRILTAINAIIALICLMK